jgi:predicted transcriptional regulator
MSTATTAKRKRVAAAKPKPSREHAVSIRLDGKTMQRLAQIAEEMERSKSSVLTRAVREYVEREFALIEGLRESERDFAEGRTVSNEELKNWLGDRSTRAELSCRAY